MELTQLIPVDQWVYDLYRVRYLLESGEVFVTDYVASSYEGHLETDIEERWPGPHCKTYEWERIEENVGHPRSVGHMYGRSVSEGGIEHGRRLARKRGLI